MQFLQSSLLPAMNPITRVKQLMTNRTLQFGITIALLIFSRSAAALGGNAAATQIFVNAALAATSGAEGVPAASGSAASRSVSGRTYYLAPAGNGGNDSNNGLSSGSPWLTPNHSLNCGDVIVALASRNYNAANFSTGKWGWVSCPAANSVAWLKCQKFDACKITSNTGSGIWVDRSFWGVQGWEVTTTSGAIWGGCFVAAPNYQYPTEIHHIIFANNVANGCQASGLGSYNNGKNAGVDYFAIVGNIAYNATQSRTECYSGISIYNPIQLDWQGGTHIYVAGNFSYGNFMPNPCAGGMPTDGNGIIFDSFDGNADGMPNPYGAQAVAEDNILLGNAGMGISVGHSNSGRPPFATIYIRHNTMWGNNAGRDENWMGCGELNLNRTTNTIATYNLAATNSATGCGYNPIYALAVSMSDSSVQVSNNFAYSASGYNLQSWDNGTFSYGSSNTVGVNPYFQNPVQPGPPNCGGSASVPNCMSPVTANFLPRAQAASGFGYQSPQATGAYDPLFPQWLCYANLPPGLITMRC